jgi:hypothetical protein
LPKTIRHSDGRAAGAILGFANFVLRLYVDERPRAVIVGWDTLEAPTKRHEMFPAYQGGREFDDALIEQLKVLPELMAAFGFANAEAAGYEAVPGSGQNAPLNCCNGTGHLMASSKPVSFKRRRRCSASIGSSRQWMRKRRCPHSPIRLQNGAQLRPLRAIGD